MMTNVFTRNYFLFAIILLLCVGSLIYTMVTGDDALNRSNRKVSQTYETIARAELIPGLIEGMLAAQRGYILTSEEKFLEEYNGKKAVITETIAELAQLTAANTSQTSRLDELRKYFHQFSMKLEERTRRFSSQQLLSNFLDDIGTVDSLRDNLERVNSLMLKEEYGLLRTRIKRLEAKKSEYFTTLITSVAVGTVLLLLINGFLLNAQRRRTRAEQILQETEERFQRAIEGTRDGIFDWDILGGYLFFSERFFEMLGYDKPAHYGSIDEVVELVHNDDIDRLWNRVASGDSSGAEDYVEEFRMRHHNGRWIWVQARARVTCDKQGRAVRISGAHTDISDEIRAQEKLVQEKRQAEQASRSKSEFLAHMSHEIRTPLTAVTGIAEMLSQRSDQLPEKTQRLVDTLLSSAVSLRDLVTDILDFSKIESGEVELNENVFSLEQLFDEITAMMALRASQKGISFFCNYAAVAGIDFIGDRSRLRQICVNLVGNAVKFTDDGRVDVTVAIENREGNDFLRIDVSDTGIGIAAEDFDLIFEQFRQADASVSRRYGGTGLGLPISRNLAQLMGGQIYISSTVGQGSTFSLLVPLRTMPAVATQLSGEDPHQLNEHIAARINHDTRILVVEDYDGNVVLLSSLLEELGLGFDVARTGVEALVLYHQRPYAMILMDIQMPVMDGFTATSCIREHEKSSGRHTPVIGMTAHALVGDREKCIEAGMDLYLPKPLVQADLKRAILQCLSA